MSGSVFAFILRLLDFLIYFGFYLEYCLFCGEGSCFLLFSVTFVSDVCLSIYYTCVLLCLLLVCWVRENFSGGSGHIFFVWDSAVWSAGLVQFILVLSWGGWRDCTGFSFSLALL
jgi:hypothetical protein